MADDRYLDTLSGAAFSTGLLSALARQIAEQEERQRWESQTALQRAADARAQAADARTAEQAQYDASQRPTLERQRQQALDLQAEQTAGLREQRAAAAELNRQRQALGMATTLTPGVVVSPQQAEMFETAGMGHLVPGVLAERPEGPVGPADDPRSWAGKAFVGLPQQQQLQALLADPNTPDEVKQYLRARAAAGDENLPYQLFQDPQDGDVNWQQFQGRRTQSSPIEYFERHPRTGAVRDAQGNPVSGVLPVQGYADIPPQVEGRILTRVQQFDTSAASKTASEVIAHWNRVADVDPAAEGMTRAEQAAMDAALIYTYAKAADPASAVREGEYATVQEWATNKKDAFILNMIRLVQTAQLLTPDARAAIKDRIGRFANAAVQERNRHVPTLESDLRRIAGQFGEPAWRGWREEAPLPYASGEQAGAPVGTPAVASPPAVRRYNPATGQLEP